MDDRTLLHITLAIAVLVLATNGLVLREMEVRKASAVASSGPPANTANECRKTCDTHRDACQEECDDIPAQCTDPSSSAYTRIFCRDMIENCNFRECDQTHQYCLYRCAYMERRR